MHWRREVEKPRESCHNTAAPTTNTAWICEVSIMGSSFAVPREFEHRIVCRSIGHWIRLQLFSHLSYRIYRALNGEDVAINILCMPVSFIFCVSVYLPTCLSVCLIYLIYLSICLCICLSTTNLSVSLSLSICLPSDSYTAYRHPFHLAILPLSISLDGSVSHCDNLPTIFLIYKSCLLKFGGIPCQGDFVVRCTFKQDNTGLLWSV
jgi:hypothetical protein